MCLSSSPSEAAVLNGPSPCLSPPAVLGSQLERKWCRCEEQSEVEVRTSDAFCLSALRRDCCLLLQRNLQDWLSPAEISGCYVPCLHLLLICQSPSLREWDISTRWDPLVTCLPCTALNPNYTHSPVEKEPSGDVCFLLKLLWPSSFLTRFQTLFSKGRV